jgi:drug/metabolite transporter (DMT)-like permease
MDTENKLIIIGAVLAIIGLILVLYGNSLNFNADARLISGMENPGTMWMVLGGASFGLSVILFGYVLTDEKDNAPVAMD